MAEEKNLGTTSIGIAPNIAGGLSYLFGIISGILFYVLEKENKFVRFHAMQSTLFCAAWIVINIVLLVIPIIGLIIAALLNIAGLILWLIVMIKAFSGEQMKLPIIGEMAEKNA